jgi:DNA-binding transcriptional ArsR family regulator
MTAPVAMRSSKTSLFGPLGVALVERSEEAGAVDILERLAGGPATIGELAEPFGLTLNAVRKHVGILEDVSLVVTARVGRARECGLGPAHLDDASAWIEGYRRSWEDRLSRFADFVEDREDWWAGGVDARPVARRGSPVSIVGYRGLS